MAIVLQNFSPALQRVPFVTQPDMQRMVTAVPRAMLYAVTNTEVLDAKPLNDQHKAQFTINLPTTFAYRLIAATINFQQDQSDDWEDQGELQITNAMRGQPIAVTTHHTIPKTNGSTFATITGNAIWTLEQVPTFILQSLRQNVAPGLDFRFSNDLAGASTAGVVNFFGYFFEYDIEQVQLFPPLVPVLTYSIA